MPAGVPSWLNFTRPLAQPYRPQPQQASAMNNRVCDVRSFLFFLFRRLSPASANPATGIMMPNDGVRPEPGAMVRSRFGHRRIFPAT